MENPQLRRKTNERQQIIEHAELRMEHHGPNQRDRDRCRHHRHDEDGAQEAASQEFLMKYDSGERAEDQGCGGQDSHGVARCGVGVRTRIDAAEAPLHGGSELIEVDAGVQ